MDSRSSAEPEPSLLQGEVMNKPIFRRLITELKVNSLVWQGHFWLPH